MREEPRKKGSAGNPPDVGVIRQVAYERFLAWDLGDLHADAIADKVMDSAEEGGRTDQTFLPNIDAVRRWVSRVVQFHALNLIESGKRHVRIEDVPEPELVVLGAVSVQPEEEEPDPRLAAMDAIAATMPPRWREVWRLIKEDLKRAEIAPILHIKLRTVNKYVELIYRTMREALAAEREQGQGRKS